MVALVTMISHQKIYRIWPLLIDSTPTAIVKCPLSLPQLMLFLLNWFHGSHGFCTPSFPVSPPAPPTPDVVGG